MGNMAFGKVLNQKMNISYISAQINKIGEAVLPLQKSSAALQDSLPRHTHTHTHFNSAFFGAVTHKALSFNVAAFTVKTESEH